MHLQGHCKWQKPAVLRWRLVQRALHTHDLMGGLAGRLLHALQPCKPLGILGLQW